ncbi:hypothetical protein [Methanocella sp. MCL-LM]|uniref:hypothetical protein n=1 Tax=Methanocella sp. MCL-LM TaxID=3412035 RepID=UPI003C72611C
MEREQYNSFASDAVPESLVATVTRGSMIVLIALGVLTGLLALVVLGGIKLMVGDFPPGFIMLLFVGFVLSMVAGWRLPRYQGHLAVLGISMLAIAGLIWAIFEDGLMGKAFMLLLVVSAGFMAALGFYNLFIKKKQLDVP